MPLYTYAPILQIVRDACSRLNLVRPTGVYDSADENAVIMGSLANVVGPMMQDLYKWQQFIKEFEVIGDGVKAEFALPDDYSRFSDMTGWSHANRRPVQIVNDVQWNSIKAWVSQSFFINPACRIFADELQFMTPPADNERITFEYISKNWVIDGITPSEHKEQLTANADTPMHDSLLFALALQVKWLETRGMPTQAPRQDFNERLQQLMGRNAMAGPISLNGGSMLGMRYLNGANMPDTGYGP